MSARGWQIEPLARCPESFWHSWDALNEHYNASHPLLSSRFVRSLIRHFATGELMACTLAGGGVTHAHAVLRRTGFGRASVFCPSQAPLSLLLTDPAERGGVALVRSLLESLGVTSLRLSVPLQDAPYSAATVGEDPVVTRGTWGTTINVDLSGGFETYWSARSKDLRKNIRRYTTRASESGLPPRLVETREPAAIPEAVARYATLESQGWKGKAGTSLAPGNAQARFYQDLLEQFATSGDARVFELFLGDRLAASRLLVSGPKMFVILKTTYDEELKQYAPGRLLLHAMLEHLAANGGNRIVEFYTRANEDVLAWSTHRRPIVNVEVVRNRLVASLLALRKRAKPEPEAPPAAPQNPESASGANNA